MTSRILPPDEWSKLAGTELETVWPHLSSAANVIVVEDGAEIVACWALYPVLHAEGVWIAPSHRKRGSVARRLLAAMRAQIAALGARAVMTGAVCDDVRALIAKLHGVPAGEQYLISLGGK